MFGSMKALNNESILCIVVIIGVCLCLIELRYLSGRNGVRSIVRVETFF